MDKQKIKIRKKRRQKGAWKMVLFKILLVVVPTAVIVSVFPQNDNQIPSYELNQPWGHATLYSELQFNIMMSDSAINFKKDSVKVHFTPYFKQDAKCKATVKSNFYKKAVRSKINPLLTKRIMACLDSIYDRGVVEYGDLDTLNSDSTLYIKVIDSRNFSANYPVNRLFTPGSAYIFLKDVISNLDSTDYMKLMSADNDSARIDLTITENLNKDSQKTNDALAEDLEKLSTTLGFIKKGEKIVDKGDIVNTKLFLTLNSYYENLPLISSDSSTINWKLLGYIFIVLVVNGLLVGYLSVFRKNYLEDKRSAILQFSLITFFCIVASLMIKYQFYHIFLLPCCMVPIFIRVMYDSRTAFAFHCGMVLIISLILVYPYEFIILNIAAGTVLLLYLKGLSDRKQIFIVVLLVALTYTAVYVSLQLATTDTQPTSFPWSLLKYFAINSGLLILTFPMFWLMEKCFGTVTDMTLLELSNLEQPLLKQLSADAPGTYQHSNQVANLAADVAERIGAKSLLVRVGALYHDIGKIGHPVFFTENQSGDNPHRYLTPVKSAEVIISHVTNGLALAEKHHLPQVIRNFIGVHHGMSKTQYFLVTYKNEHPDESIDETLFTYPGPNPQTKEEAILMMADAVEAASRSLETKTEENINDLVDRIIDSQVAGGYFNESTITLRDISRAKEVLKDRLRSIYHPRISYPELNKPDSQA